MKRLLVVSLIVIALCVSGAPVVQAAVEWRVAEGGNGHWYEAMYVATAITWSGSKAAAEDAGGYLATITSEAENNFVFSLIMDRPELWSASYPWLNGPWLGGYQDQNDPSYSEPLGGWKWVSGESWSYTNWMQGEPSGGGQDSLHYCGYDLLVAPTWDDAGAPYLTVLHGLQTYSGYVVEWNSNPIPEPSGLMVLACGLVGFGAMIRARRR